MRNAKCESSGSLFCSHVISESSLPCQLSRSRLSTPLITFPRGPPLPRKIFSQVLESVVISCFSRSRVAESFKREIIRSVPPSSAHGGRHALSEVLPAIYG